MVVLFLMGLITRPQTHAGGVGSHTICKVAPACTCSWHESCVRGRHTHTHTPADMRDDELFCSAVGSKMAHKTARAIKDRRDFVLMPTTEIHSKHAVARQYVSPAPIRQH